MGHHNFSPGEDLVNQMALKSIREHLDERTKTDEIEALLAEIKTMDPAEPTREELEAGLRKLAEREIPEHVRMQMRLDRAKAEAEQIRGD